MRCGVHVASVRAQPSVDAEQVTQALLGEELAVEERRGGWCHVVTSYGYPGWMREEQLVEGAPIELARAFLGTPYEWGGVTAQGIDCSGLVHMAYRLAGRVAPRDAAQQAEAGADAAEPEVGDHLPYGE